jgi:hypothetical protein
MIIFLLLLLPAPASALTLAEIAVSAHTVVETCNRVDIVKKSLDGLPADCKADIDCRRSLLDTYVPLFTACADAKSFYQSLIGSSKCGKNPNSPCRVPRPEYLRARQIVADLKAQIKVTTNDPERRSYCHYVQEAFDAKKFEACPKKADVYRQMDARQRFLELSHELEGNMKLFQDD